MSRHISGWSGAGALTLAVGLFACAGCEREVEATAAAGAGSLVSRGEYLVTVMSCHDCHTPHDQNGKPVAGRELTGHPAGAQLPEWDPSMLERGVLVTIAPTFTAFAGPFGVSIAPNLTPDPTTGLGGMTAEQLIDSWRTGKHWRTGQPILPPMPAGYFAKLTDSDIRAVHAYLMSLSPKTPEPLAIASE